MSWAQRLEKFWPYIGAALVVVCWWKLFDTTFPLKEHSDSLFGTAATVASVFASFLGVAKAIILGMKNTAVWDVLRKNNYTDFLFGYLKAGIFASVVFAAASIVGFFIDRDGILFGHNVFNWFSAVWIFLGALALFTYLRISNILFKLLKAA
jgi:hypothetical protein